MVVSKLFVILVVILVSKLVVVGVMMIKLVYLFSLIWFIVVLVVGFSRLLEMG